MIPCSISMGSQALLAMAPDLMRATGGTDAMVIGDTESGRWFRGSGLSAPTAASTQTISSPVVMWP